MKNKVLFIFGISAIIMMISIFSCQKCGPFPSKYKLVKINIGLAELGFDEAQKHLSGPGSIVSDSLAFDSLDIALNFEIQTFFTAVSPYSFSLFSQAYACDPPLPTTTEFITKFDVYTQVAFDTDHPKDSSLVDLFDVIVENSGESIHLDLFDLKTYIATKPKIPDVLHLRLKSTPSISQKYDFTIKYVQDGIDVDSLTLKTEQVLLHN